MHKTLLFILLLPTTLVYSQKKTKIIKGIITDEHDIVTNAHIINLTTKQGTFSNDEGSFSMTVSLDDQLQITSIQHQTKIITMVKVIINDEKLTIQLATKTNLLKEVVVKKHQLSGDLLSDTKKTPTNYKEERVGKMTSGIKGMMSEISRMPIGSDEIRYSAAPIVGLPNQFQGLGVSSSSGKRLKKERERKKRLQQKQDFPHKLLQELGSHFFTDELKIPKEKHYHFISFCEYKGIQKLFYSNEILPLIEILKKESLRYLNESNSK
ncbi:hypothetical protein SAMN04489761_0826 [Tenacibaculum sp. MAR_2009_124]|uniref:hypothetical protein n=1 Tax=Tenacibaculum sp. MAR_2009_124 TaxID=1250059 RepID=UPI000896FE16|nr:hypothetical protein [Tenacibaculum sp. MAR_2009_124]SEB45619.1 hypothetical protein SAMN04489761_0826 [Tenacibaculum sp. MAR_2009_124]